MCKIYSFIHSLTLSLRKESMAMCELQASAGRMERYVERSIGFETIWRKGAVLTSRLGWKHSACCRAHTWGGLRTSQESRPKGISAGLPGQGRGEATRKAPCHFGRRLARVGPRSPPTALPMLPALDMPPTFQDMPSLAHPMQGHDPSSVSLALKYPEI